VIYRIFVLILCCTNSLFAQSIVTIMTYNVLHGANTDGSLNFDKIAEQINRINPDLVALQEVDFKTNRINNIDLTKELATRTNMISCFGKAMNYDDGEYGVAILSKRNIIKSENNPLPYSENNEPRTALEILTTSALGDTLIFISTHLDHKSNDVERIGQANKIITLFESNKYPSILAGDFNDTPNSKTINLLETYWTTTYSGAVFAKTFSSNNPDRKIDYIMFKPKNSFIIIDNGVVCDSLASDHCAYWVKLELVK
jgi:endonuclease/exonuclease/phosphatase family metal-dependent hydrolase